MYDLPENKVKCGLLLDVVVAESPAVFELLARKNQTLLVGWDTAHRILECAQVQFGLSSPFLVLNLGLDIIDGV